MQVVLGDEDMQIVFVYNNNPCAILNHCYS